jgi:rfaE bifunctional protein nucleotidyltransferase chain/domain/rfaE bifunctional protein kinase chain/domain
VSDISIVVVGDALLDVDLVGEATRLAPDAPVPVIDDAVESARPGGAALAATMLAAEHADVTVVTALGDDGSSRRLRDALRPDVTLIELPLRGELPRKVRVRAGEQSLARLDYGHGAVDVRDNHRDVVRQALTHADAVLVSDYGKGVVSALRDVLAGAARRRPLVWDPHPNGAAPVPDAAAVTPNRAEAARFAGNALTSRSLRDVTVNARTLFERWAPRSVCVTMGADGALLSFGDDSPLVVPAPQGACVDACGAGDRFAGVFAAALGAGAIPSEAVAAAVLAASEFVRVGVAHAFDAAAPRHPLDGDVFQRAQEVRDRGGTVVATGGCFDLLHAGHVETLRAARSLGDFLVVCLNSDASVTRLKGPGRPLVPEADRARVLGALDCVGGVVIFDQDTPTQVLRRLRPHVWAKGGDYDGRSLPEAAALSQWGGQAVVLPYLDGRSTSALVSAANGIRQ